MRKRCISFAGNLIDVGRRQRTLFLTAAVAISAAGSVVVLPGSAAADVSAATEIEATTKQTAPAGHRPYGLSGAGEFRSSNPAVVPQWEDAARRLVRDAPTIAACDADPAECRSPRVRRWRAVVRDLQGAAPAAQLRAINRFANEIVPYRSDQRVYRRADHWAAPLRMLLQGGDCEDFAILKFVSLLDLGFRNDQMRIVVVRDTVRDQPHAVLVVEQDGVAYVLDSLFNEILPLQGVGRYRPHYSVNLTHHWTHLTPLVDTGSQTSKSTAKVSLGAAWIMAAARRHAGGFHHGKAALD